MFRALTDKLFGNRKASKSTAKSRLQFVLVQDRTGLTNEEMRDFRGELVEVIKRYFVIDEQGFDIDYERQGETTTLLINSPVVVRRQEALNGVAGARPSQDRASKGKATAAKTGRPSRSRRKRRANRQKAGSGTAANV